MVTVVHVKMGHGNRNRNRRRQRSDDSENNGNVEKAGIFTQSPKNDHVSVSDVLSQTNSILYTEENSARDISNNCETIFETVLDQSDQSDLAAPLPTHPKMASLTAQQKENDPANKSVMPTNADIMKCLSEISSRLNVMDERLQKLDLLEKNVDQFDKDMKHLWARVHDHKVQTDERLSKVEERVESTDFSVGYISEKLCDPRKERHTLKDEVCYLQSQFMRNNLVFGNIQEIDSEDREKVLRQFLVEKMKIAQDLVNEIRFERVHRMGLKTVRKSRNIVAKFTFFKERELVRKHWN